MSKTYYLGVFPTPGGDKHHLFTIEGQGGTITNSMGPVTLTDFSAHDGGFSADMPAGLGKHHFEATYTKTGIHVVGTVIMEGNPVGTYEADMALAADGTLPDDPEGPSGSPDGPSGPPPQQPDPVNDPIYKTLYPGVYTPEEEQLLQKIREDLYYHRVDGTSGVKPNSGTGPAQVDFTMTEDMLRGFAYANNQYNPLFTDPEYAKGTKWGQIIAAPCMQPTDVQFPSLPDNTGIYDGIQRFVPGKGLDHEVYFLRPLVAGKHYHSVNYYDTVEDLTDPKGSAVRAFRIAGYGALVDDLGQEYVKIRHSTVEIYGMLKDKSKAADYPSDLGRTIQARAFEPVRQYTDADYEKMMDLWRKEYVRGKDTLYWEDVEVGYSPNPVSSHPLTLVDAVYMGGEFSMMNAGRAKETIRTQSGNPDQIYVTEDGIRHMRRVEQSINTMGEFPRLFVMMAYGRRVMLNMITGFIGDDGWLRRLNWRNGPMANPIIRQVPGMEDAVCDTHICIGDMVVCKAVAVRKYKDEEGAKVDFICWNETFEGHKCTAAEATVILPTRE